MHLPNHLQNPGCASTGVLSIWARPLILQSNPQFIEAAKAERAERPLNSLHFAWFYVLLRTYL